jgi:hypothetical protein
LGTPRIALFDIETAPLRIWSWQVYETNAIEVDQDAYILTFAMKWLGEKKIRTFALPDYPNFKKDKTDDSALVRDLHRMMSEADIIVAQNGDQFDLKMVNTRFLIHGMEPAPPIKSIDTLKEFRKNFMLHGNSQDNVCRRLGTGRKLPHTGKKLWFDCMKGVPRAVKLMRRYNAQDVRGLEGNYLKIRPFMKNHPNLNAWSGRDACPACQSSNIQQRGFNVAKTRKAQRLQCRDCGHWYSKPLDRLTGATSSLSPSCATPQTNRSRRA